MTNEIEPCPFCGDSVHADDRSNFLGDAKWKVECANEECPSNRVFDTQAEAIAAWNTRLRSQPASSSEEVRELLQIAIEDHDAHHGKSNVAAHWTNQARAALGLAAGKEG